MTRQPPPSRTQIGCGDADDQPEQNQQDDDDESQNATDHRPKPPEYHALVLDRSALIGDRLILVGDHLFLHRQDLLVSRRLLSGQIPQLFEQANYSLIGHLVLPGVLGCPLIRRESFLNIPPPSRLGQKVGEREIAQVARNRDIGCLDPNHRPADSRRHLFPRPLQETD